MMLDHEKLDVCKCAIEFVSVSVQIIESLPKGYASLSDQLKRASWSIPLNIAEGTGKIRMNDKIKFYSIARGSAMECGAVLDVCSKLGMIDDTTFKKGKDLLTRIVSMLTKMCRI